MLKYNDFLENFKNYLNDGDDWTETDIEEFDIESYVENLREEYELNNFLCNRLMSDFKNILEEML